MDNKKIQILGEPVNQHGSYTFYKSFKYLTKNGQYKTISISEFFFVKIWNDSDLVSIGELQLLWEDKNSDKILSSLRLYFLPENTPDGRREEHGEDEVMSITEKVVLKVDDLVTWIIQGDVEWRWGHQATWKIIPSMSLNPSQPQEGDTAEQTSEQAAIPGGATEQGDENQKPSTKTTSSKASPGEVNTTQSVVVLSFPRYCRYRSIARRLDGATDHWMQSALVAALGGILGVTGFTRVLFCKETFDYPELEGHELLCNHLTPKLAGRPRKKRKKRSSSPSSESNESEGSSFSAGSSSGKVRSPSLQTVLWEIDHVIALQVTRSGARQAAAAASVSPRCAPEIPSATPSANPNMPRTARMGARGSLTSRTGTASQAAGSREEQEFLRGLYAFMEKHKSPIDRIPSLGFKQIDLFAFYKKVHELGGYQQVTTRKMWKRVYDEMGGSQSNTSAATCTRKHYERLLLTYEKRLALEKKQPPKRREVQPSTPEVVKQDTPAATTEENKPHTVTEPIEDPDAPVIVEEVISNPPQRRKSTSSIEERPALKKRKLEILQQGGLEVTPIGQPPSTTPQSVVTSQRRSLEMMGSTAPNVGSNQVSITVTPDVSHMLSANTEDTFKPPPPHRVTHHMFSRTGRIYDNPKVDLNRDRLKPDLEVLDLTVKSTTTSSLIVKAVKTTSTSSLTVKTKESALMLPPPSKVPELSILPHHNGHPLSNHNHQKMNNHHQHHLNKLSSNNKVKVPPRANLSSSLEITLVDNSSSSSTSSSSDHQKAPQHNGKPTKHHHHHHSHSQSSLQHSKVANSPFHIPLFPDPTLYYAALYNSQLYQNVQGIASSMPPGSVSPHELYKSLLLSHHHASSLPLLASLNQSYPGLPRDGSTSITPLPRPK